MLCNILRLINLCCFPVLLGDRYLVSHVSVSCACGAAAMEQEGTESPGLWKAQVGWGRTLDPALGQGEATHIGFSTVVK